MPARFLQCFGRVPVASDATKRNIEGGKVSTAKQQVEKSTALPLSESVEEPHAMPSLESWSFEFDHRSQRVMELKTPNFYGTSACRMMTFGQPGSRAPQAGASFLPVCGTEAIMSEKANGSTEQPVQAYLRWNVDRDTAVRLCCYNRKFAERTGYWRDQSTFLKEVDRTRPTTFCDSVTGLPLFVAPVGRKFAKFEKESTRHGWLSFRDQEVQWDEVRVLRCGEIVSKAGTHLGYNMPDHHGNRYCINIVAVAGRPPREAQTTPQKTASFFLPYAHQALSPGVESTPLEASKISYGKHKELGRVHWIRNLEEGFAIAKASNKPVFCLFQEIPGCSTCTNFGTQVLCHKDTVASIENDFVPVAIFNNTKGYDKEICKQYEEPFWNNPVVRFLDPETGKDIIPRMSRVWAQPDIEKRMKQVLRKMYEPAASPSSTDHFNPGSSQKMVSTFSFRVRRRSSSDRD